MPFLRTKGFAVAKYADQTSWVKFAPSTIDWKDLKEDARACAATGKLNLRITWRPERKYWLEGTGEALERFDWISKAAACRLGYLGPDHVVCLLERLLERVSLSSWELFAAQFQDLRDATGRRARVQR